MFVPLASDAKQVSLPVDITNDISNMATCKDLGKLYIINEADCVELAKHRGYPSEIVWEAGTTKKVLSQSERLSLSCAWALSDKTLLGFEGLGTNITVIPDAAEKKIIVFPTGHKYKNKAF